MRFVTLTSEFRRAQQPAHAVLILKRAEEKEFTSNQQDLDTVWVQTLRGKSQDDVAKQVQRESWFGAAFPWEMGSFKPPASQHPSLHPHLSSRQQLSQPTFTHSSVTAIFQQSLQYSSAIFRQKACPALLCWG